MNRKSIQVLRGTQEKIKELSSSDLLDGQPLYDKTNNYLYVGNNTKDVLEPVTTNKVISEKAGFVPTHNETTSTLNIYNICGASALGSGTGELNLKMMHFNTEAASIKLSCPSSSYGKIALNSTQLDINTYMYSPKINMTGPGIGSATIDFPLKSGTVALTSDIPTAVSSLTNDSQYVTLNELNNKGYLTKKSYQHNIRLDVSVKLDNVTAMTQGQVTFSFINKDPQKYTTESSLVAALSALEQEQFPNNSGKLRIPCQGYIMSTNKVIRFIPVVIQLQWTRGLMEDTDSGTMLSYGASYTSPSTPKQRLWADIYWVDIRSYPGNSSTTQIIEDYWKTQRIIYPESSNSSLTYAANIEISDYGQLYWIKNANKVCLTRSLVKPDGSYFYTVGDENRQGVADTIFEIGG